MCGSGLPVKLQVPFWVGLKVRQTRKYLFISILGRAGCLWVCGLPPVAVCGLLISVAALAAEHRLMGLVAPGPGIELVSPALAGRFLTAGPAGKSQTANQNALLLLSWVASHLL